MGQRTVMDAKVSTHEAGPRRNTQRARALGLGKPDAFASDRVKVGRGGAMIPIAPKVIRTHRVDVDRENGRASWLRLTPGIPNVLCSQVYSRVCSPQLSPSLIRPQVLNCRRA